MIITFLYFVLPIIFFSYCFINERKNNKEYQKLIDERLKSNKELSGAINHLKEVTREIEREYKKKRS